MFTALCLGAIVTSHQGAKVNVEIKGVRMVNAAPILAQALGLDSLSIGPTLKNDVILFRAKDASVADVKNQFAKIFNATWEQKSDGWWLKQSSEQKIADQRTYDKNRYKYFSELTEKAQKRIQGLKPLDEAECNSLQAQLKAISSSTVSQNNSLYQRTSKIDGQGPMSRFGYRAVLRLTPDIWMKLNEDSPRAVFSTKPTNMQRPFPFRVDDLIAQVIDDENNWVNYAGTEPLPGPSLPGEPNSHYYLGSLNNERKAMKFSDFSTVTMALQLGGQGVVFKAYDAKGKSTLNTTVSFPDFGEDFTEEMIKSEITRMMKKTVNLTGDAGEYLDMFAPRDPMRGIPQNIKSVSSSLRAKLIQPEKIDPLSIAAGDVFLASVDTPNALMIMSDDFRSTRFIDFNSPLLRRQDTCHFSNTDGWTIVSFNDPVAARKRMPDRQKLGKLLRFINDNQRPLTLEEQALFTYELPWDAESEYSYQSHLRPLQTTVVESMSNRTAMRIYGSMSSGIRDRAKKGPVPVSSLSAETKLEIFRSLFYSGDYEAQVQMEWRNVSTPADQQKMQNLQELIYGGLYQEKTFLLPNGLVNNLSITLEDTSTDSLYCGRPEGGQYYGNRGRTMSPESLGQYLFRITNPAKYPFEFQAYSKIDENDIRLASTRSITIKLNLENDLHIHWELGQTFTTDPHTYTSKTLPQTILDQIKKGFEEGQKNDKYYNVGQPTRTNPPPR